MSMTFTSDSFCDWLQVGFTIAAGIYVLYLFRQSNREKRSKHVYDIINWFYSDNEIRTIIYTVDSGHNVKEIKFKGLLELQADKTIKYFDYIGYLIKEGDLKQKDIRPLKYEIDRVLNKGTVQEDINWLRKIGVPLENLKYLKK